MCPGLSRAQLKKKLTSVCSSTTLDEMIGWVKQRDPNLWGQFKPDKFIQDNVLLTLYKDLSGFGFKTLENEINFGYPMSHNSMQHNIPLVRGLLRDWAMTYIKVGSVTDWKKVARKAQAAKGKVADTTLWIDSIDLPLIGTQSISRTGDRWSYKLNGSGLRFATVSDASGRVLKVWGGHTPKLHDSEFLSVNRDEFEEVFAGGMVAGDNHFAKGQKIFKDVRFHVNIAQRTL